VYGRSGIAAKEGEPRARVGVRSGAGAKGIPSTSSLVGDDSAIFRDQ
jgi:hypothetical protein